MLELKFARELLWADLKHIEAPLHALRTIQKNHGAKFALEDIRNAHKHDLPRQGFRRMFDPYSRIQQQLENGQTFLINRMTRNPALTKLELLDDDHVKWELRGAINHRFRTSIESIIARVPKPKPYGIHRQEPAKQNDDKPKKDEPVYEYHKILLDVEADKGRPLPERHNITLYANNTTQSRRVVKQLKNAIDDPFSRKFRTEKGDAFNVYVVPDEQTDIINQVNKIGDLAQCESDGLITALTETGQETDSDGTILHHFKYVVPSNYVEIELLDEDGNPEAGTKYKILDLNGKLLARGSLDENGYANVEHLITDEIKVVFDDFDTDAVKPE